MMVTRSAPFCGLTNPSGPERFRSETHHGDYRTEDAAISSRGAAPAAKLRPVGLEAPIGGAAKPASYVAAGIGRGLTRRVRSPAGRSNNSSIHERRAGLTRDIRPRAYAGTTGTLSLRKARISCSLLFRCALTSSGGVSASH